MKKIFESLLQILKIIFSGRMGKAVEDPQDLDSVPEKFSEPESESVLKPEPVPDSDPVSEPDYESSKTLDEPEIFKKALKLTLKYEGGYINHEADPGGATNKGITQKVYDTYRKSKYLGVKDVREITDEEVEDIYFKNYWLTAKCDELPDNLATIHFDTAVNSGIRQASKFLQRAIDVSDDGIIGNQTLEKIKEVLSGKGEMAIVKNYLEQRRAFFKLIVEKKPQLQVFLKGWLNRVASLENYIDSETRIV